MLVNIPYGKTSIPIVIPDKNFLDTLLPKDLPGYKNPDKAVKEALRNPINNEPLSKIVDKNDEVAIIVDDVTRPLPTHFLLPYLIREIKSSGIRNDRITIIIGTGIHRGITNQEARMLLGSEIVEKFRWINHDCDAKDLVYVGRTSFGNEVYINRIYYEADVKIIVSDITFHYYAGYGGGAKSIIPGIAGRTTIEFNHSMMFHPKAKSGITKGNPVFEDIWEGASLVGCDFALSVVLNSKKEIVSIFAGDLKAVFYEGKKIVDDMYRIPLKEKADIVIAGAGGFPHDINLYQASVSYTHLTLPTTERV